MAKHFYSRKLFHAVLHLKPMDYITYCFKDQFYKLHIPKQSQNQLVTNIHQHTLFQIKDCRWWSKASHQMASKHPQFYKYRRICFNNPVEISLALLNWQTVSLKVQQLNYLLSLVKRKLHTKMLPY